LNVIVQYSAAPTTADLNQLALYGQVVQVFAGINAVMALEPPKAIATIAANPDVEYITPNRALKGKLDLTSAAVNAAAAASYGLDGTGVGIAIIDSGITVRNDLDKSGGTARVVYSQDFTGSGSTTDGYGHGTHVTAIAAGNGTSSKGNTYSRTFQGIAPNANIVNLRVLDSSGQGSDSEVIAAIERAIALKSTYNIRVINLSLGRPVYESYRWDPLCQEVEAAWRAGIVVAVAAGKAATTAAALTATELLKPQATIPTSLPWVR
jgi:serine protease AprX